MQNLRSVCLGGRGESTAGWWKINWDTLLQLQEDVWDASSGAAAGRGVDERD